MNEVVIKQRYTAVKRMMVILHKKTERDEPRLDQYRKSISRVSSIKMKRKPITDLYFSKITPLK